MKSVISVELDGTTFAMDEPAYRALRSYLDRAGERLGAHPDRADVIAGLERSIAAKLRRRAPGAETIDEAAMQAALKEVGRVDGPALHDSSPPRPALGYGEPRSRKLYRLREGSWVAGVCAGLAAYASVDATVVRILFLVVTFFSGGIVILVYLVLAFTLPPAPADGDVGDARGGAPPR